MPSSKTDLIQYLSVCVDLAQKGGDSLAYVSPVLLRQAIELLDIELLGTDETSAPNKEVNDLRNHIFNGVDLIEHLLRDPTGQAKAWAREWCATEISRSAVEPKADYCEKHGAHRAFAGGCPGCYHEKHDLPRSSEKAFSGTVDDVMCPHGYNRLVMEADGTHCAECSPLNGSEATKVTK